MQYVLDTRAALDSLILAGSPASMPRWIRECNELRDELPAEEREILDRHEANGWTACPEYQGALVTFYRRHVCRLDPWPEGLERSFAEAGYDVYTTMNGPSEFTVTGNFKDWDVTERLDEIGVPTLVVGGEHDEARPAHMESIAASIPGARLRILEDASHLCFWEKREEFMAAVNDFLDRVESEAA
jgi:proline-specific peptidase